MVCLRLAVGAIKHSSGAHGAPGGAQGWLRGSDTAAHLPPGSPAPEGFHVELDLRVLSRHSRHQQALKMLLVTSQSIGAEP